MGNLREKLQAVQTELKAPKNLYNSFGGYKYRNAEGILEALKPLEKKFQIITTISDSITAVNDRIYITATVTVYDTETDEKISVSAMAREAESKKGMDSAQVTGATSSYARKYALNGMFLLDDTKDIDSNEYQTESEKRHANDKRKAAAAAPVATAPETAPADKQIRQTLVNVCNENGINVTDVAARFKLNNDSTAAEFSAALNWLNDFINSATAADPEV